MILDHMDNQMGDNASHMMDWGPDTWLYTILGFIIFLIIVIVLIYILNRGPNLVEKQPSIQTQNSYKLSGKNRVEDYTRDENNYCSYCGATLENITIKSVSYTHLTLPTILLV